MLKRLQQKWKVGGWQLLLIICTFAIGGSVTGYAARKLMPFLGIEQGWLWVIVYIIVLTIIWPMAVLLISIPFGQFRFFSGYLRKIGYRMGLKWLKSLPKLAIFASGAGSNARVIIDHFKNSGTAKVVLVVCNKPDAGVIDIARSAQIPVLMIEKEQFIKGNNYTDELKGYHIDMIILAGFLWQIPPGLIKEWPSRIINIHPALLPKFGGKGMYGHNVHEAVLAAGEKKSGITIHYVDELYDHGTIIRQVSCPVMETDSADTLAQRIHVLEHEHYSSVIDELIHQLVK